MLQVRVLSATSNNGLVDLYGARAGCKPVVTGPLGSIPSQSTNKWKMPLNGRELGLNPRVLPKKRQAFDSSIFLHIGD